MGGGGVCVLDKNWLSTAFEKKYSLSVCWVLLVEWKRLQLIEFGSLRRKKKFKRVEDTDTRGKGEHNKWRKVGEDWSWITLRTCVHIFTVACLFILTCTYVK